jgi:hypothetical protein
MPNMNGNCEDDVLQCVCYYGIIPIMLVLGLCGSAFTLILISGSGFRGLTFYYLRALSISDMVYLFFVIGYVVEIMGMGNGDINFQAKYYLTHWDIVLCNTFITNSGFIILLLTLDRYRAICHPTRPRDANPGLYMGYALVASFLLQVPKFLESHIVSKCLEVTSGNNHTLLGGVCECGANTAMLGTTCRFEAEENTNVVNTYPWIIYSVLTAMLTKILPSMLMIILNTRMINRYYKVSTKRTSIPKSKLQESKNIKLFDVSVEEKKTNITKKVSWNL